MRKSGQAAKIAAVRLSRYRGDPMNQGRDKMRKTLIAAAIVLLPGIAWAQTEQQKQGEPQDQANSARTDSLNTENEQRVQDNAERIRQQQKRDELESRIRKLEQGQ